MEPAPTNLAPGSAVIPVRSRRQALDWSLALASQGIAATLLHEAEGDRWSLAVDASDSQRAFATLKLYHLENRRLRWEQPLPWTGTMFHWGGLLWCAFLLLVHEWVLSGGTRLRAAGVMDSAAFWNGEVWRLFTAVTLHADWSHLISNLTTGFLLFGLAMARYGAGAGLLAAFVAGAGGNLAGALLYATPYRGLGASGMVMGALGLLAGGAISQGRAHPFPRKQVLAGLAAGLMLFLLLGADPNSDLLAHLGGFLSGCGLGAVLGVVPPESLHRPGVNAAGVVGLLVLLFCVWWLALS